MINHTLESIFIVWAILGIVLTFIQLAELIRFYNKIKTKSKKLIYVLLFGCLGGPIAFILVMIAILVLILVETILKPLATRFVRYIVTPIANWLIK